ncbi:hypothetical protein QR680_004490 [Steinernema hermaphroditum]|uniref:Uncharacterized protein n=1 Tax=Steinernema hermaphroditum TaxID=289476 RepID=A0AA39LU27_9BILA|nr:hypothetical protein QR680_004490 [Steinernema hermaphroditum]
MVNKILLRLLSLFTSRKRLLLRDGPFRREQKISEVTADLKEVADVEEKKAVRSTRPESTDSGFQDDDVFVDLGEETPVVKEKKVDSPAGFCSWSLLPNLVRKNPNPETWQDNKVPKLFTDWHSDHLIPVDTVLIDRRNGEVHFYRALPKGHLESGRVKDIYRRYMMFKGVCELS